MKKFMLLCAGLGLAMSLTSCKSSEKAYKQAYEKAQAQAANQQYETPVVQPVVTTNPVVTPVQTQPVTQTQVVDNLDNVSVTRENVSMVNGAVLKEFSVIVGSFSVIANAEGLQQRLKNAGYAAQIVKNEAKNMYRVVASTFDSKSAAVQSREQLRATYPDAWLLYYTR